MARKIYLRGGLGVGAFRRIYGGSKRNGSRPPHFGKSSGAIARNILQQLQTMNIVEVDSRGLVSLPYICLINIFSYLNLALWHETQELWCNSLSEHQPIDFRVFFKTVKTAL